MAYTPRSRDDQNQAQQNYPTISQLVKPQVNTYPDRQTTYSPYTNQRPIDNRYPSETNRYPSETNRYPSETNRYPSETNRYPSETNRYPSETNRYPSETYRYPSETNRTPYSTCDGTRRPDDNRYSINQLVPGYNCQEIDRPRQDDKYSRPVPTAYVTVDPIRHSYHGNARSCVMEINVTVNTGGSRTPQGSYVTQNYTSQSPAIRSQATIDNVHYINLHLQSPQNTARISTDGIINRLQ